MLTRQIEFRMNRDIKDILRFRHDIAPFLIHLTKKTDTKSAKEVLESILDEQKLKPGSNQVSDIRFGGVTNSMPDKGKEFFSAVCFTETPLSEINSLLEISARRINLEPYGLVFIKDLLTRMHVSPVLYINNHNDDCDDLASMLFALCEKSPTEAKKLLPLFSVFGKGFTPPFSKSTRTKEIIDFTWKREWRLPVAYGDFKFTLDQVFIGLCEHDQISHFEKKYPDLLFIDPRRPLKWYATSLLAARKKHEIKADVLG